MYVFSGDNAPKNIYKYSKKIKENRKYGVDIPIYMCYYLTIKLCKFALEVYIMEDKKYYEEDELMDDVEKLKKARETLEKLAKLQDKVDELKK